MEPDTHNSSSTPAGNEAARSRFLESMGLGSLSPAPADPSPNSPEQPHQTGPQAGIEEENGVVLSSLSEEISLPGANAKAPTGARVVGVQLGANAVLNRVDSLKGSATKENASPEPSPSPKEEIQGELPSIVSLEEPPPLSNSTAPAGEIPPPLEQVPSGSEKIEPTVDALPSVPENKVTDVAEKVEETALVEDAVEEGVEEESAENAGVDPNAPLHLFCPKCEGELILRREHLGVEGACVWCETKIVAAESGLDQEIRVFPVFQPDILVEKSKSDAPSPAEETVADSKEAPELTAPVEPALPAAEEESPSSEGPALDAGFETQAIWQSSFSAPEESAPAPTSEPPAEEEAAFSAADSWANSLPEAASKEPEAEPSAVESGFAGQAAGFENPVSAPSRETTEVETNGFGAAAELETPSSASAPSAEVATPDGSDNHLAGFGSPAPAAEEPPAPIASGFQDQAPSMPEADEAATASLEPSAGFGSDAAPTSFSSPPTELPAPEGFSATGAASLEDSASADTVVPEAEEPAAAPFGFQDGFGAVPSMDAMPTPAPEPSPEPTDPTTAWGATPPFEAKEPGAMEAFPQMEGGPELAAPTDFGTPPATGEPPIFSNSEPSGAYLPESHVDVAAPAAFEEAASESEMPTLGSSEGGFSIPSANQAEAFAFGASLPAPADAPAEIASVEMLPSEAAPLVEPESDSISAVANELAGEVPLKNSNKALPAPWGESKPLEAPASSPPPVPIAKPEAAKGGLFAPISSSAGDSEAGPEGGTVEKSPIGKLGSKKERKAQRKLLKSGRKPRKGLVVFLVILVGFVCGAAAASFLLPIEDYIVKAQTLMQEKFDPAAFAPILSGGEAATDAGNGGSQFPLPAPVGTEPVSPAPASPASTMPTAPES